MQQIKALLKDPDIKVRDIARQYGVCRATIFNVVGPVKPVRSASQATENQGYSSKCRLSVSSRFDTKPKD
jgi:transposase-like protein